MAAKYEIERFKGSNFSLWKMRIKAVLRKIIAWQQLEIDPRRSLIMQNGMRWMAMLLLTYI
jgi:hypothetical protein